MERPHVKKVINVVLVESIFLLDLWTKGNIYV